MTMQITFTNCADEMPPDDETKVIVRKWLINPKLMTGSLANDLIDYSLPCFAEWCYYTQAKWEYLNK